MTREVAGWPAGEKLFGLRRESAGHAARMDDVMCAVCRQLSFFCFGDFGALRVRPYGTHMAGRRSANDARGGEHANSPKNNEHKGEDTAVVKPEKESKVFNTGQLNE